MPISVVHLTTQANVTGTGGPGGLTAYISIPPVAAGNALVIALASDFTGGELAGLTDSANDTFTRALTPAASGVVGTADIWFCLNPTAGTNSIVITPGGYHPGIWIYEISGGVWLDDPEQKGSASAVTSCLGPGVSATGSSDFFVAVCGCSHNVTTVSSPWTLDPLLASATSGTQAAAHYIGTGTQAAVFTQDAASGYIIVAVSFGSGAAPGCQPATLAGAITDLCERAGLASAEVDVSLVNDTNVQPVPLLHGYLIDRPTTAAQALQEIMRAYFIDACETNGTIRFVPRAYVQSPPLVPELDLGLEEDKAELVEQQAQEEDLPISVTALYTNQQYNYQQGKQIKLRNPRILTVATRNMRTLSLPFVFLADEARQIAETDLYSSWDNRLTYKLNLWRAYWVLLDPTDRVSLMYEGAVYNVRVTSAHVGQNLTVALEAALDDVRDYNSTVVGGTSAGSSPMTGGGGTGGGGSAATGPGAPGVGPPALVSTQLWLLDIPYLQDADATPGSSGFYALMSSGAATFAGATLFESSSGASFQPLGGVTHAASFGYPTTALAAPSSPWAWDTVNTLTLQMTVGTLAGSTDADVLAGANGLVVGQEVLQFVDCTDNGGGSFTISRLLRGRRGTDGFCGSHATGEVAFAPLQGGVLHQKEPVSHIGALWYYRGVTSGATVDSATNVTLTLAGNDLKPYSVVNIGGALDGSNNWTITWTRRTRAGGSYGTGAEALIDGLNGPLNEQVESYQVDVMSGSTVKRTIATGVATAVYTAAQQTADFGAVQTSLVVNIYQMSATVGRGFQATATLPASGAPATSVVSGDTYVN